MSRIKKICDAAAGRWREVLVSVGGIDESLLDGRHHPCPKCGGVDRFSLINEERGAILCRQCFASKNGDGVAAIAWLLGVDTKGAISILEKHFDIEPRRKRKVFLSISPWSDAMGILWCKHQDGINEAGIKNAGVKLGEYRQQSQVLVFTAIGSVEGKAVGQIAYNATGGTLQKWDKSEKKNVDHKVLVMPRSGHGLILDC